MTSSVCLHARLLLSLLSLRGRARLYAIWGPGARPFTPFEAVLPFADSGFVQLALTVRIHWSSDIQSKNIRMKRELETL